MVLESIINVKTAEKKPSVMFAAGFVYVIVAAAIAYYVFPIDPSIPFVFLTTFSAIPIMVSVLKKEEKEIEEEANVRKYPLIGKHKDVFLMFTALFFGMTLAYTILYVFVPTQISSKLFSAQISTIKGVSGFITADAVLQQILVNNFKVLFFCLIFSFLFGAGAIFIIAWNASILGVAIGHTIRTGLMNLGGGLKSYFYVIPYSIGRYLTHGIFEISAYFLAGIAGGIISAAVVRYEFNSKEFKEVILDSLDLIILASLLLVIGALVEVSVTPLIF